MTTAITFQIQLQDRNTVPLNNNQIQQLNSDVTVKVSIGNMVKYREVKQVCPYSLTELLHLYRIYFPNGCPSYEVYMASPFYQKYILVNGLSPSTGRNCAPFGQRRTQLIIYIV